MLSAQWLSRAAAVQQIYPTAKQNPPGLRRRYKQPRVTRARQRVHPITIEPDVAVSTDPSADLVRRCQHGSAESFEALYRLHVGAVYALCWRMSGDANRANELTQDVFVRAWKALPTFRGESSVGTWLHRIAFNVVREDQRSTSRRRARVVESDEIVERVSPSNDGRGVSEDERIDLERAIAQLPPRARNALILHDIHGYRCREVAELTGSATGTIQAHLHRARRLLREILDR